MRHGGVQNRPGTEFSSPALDELRDIRLIPFQIDADSSCVLEFGGSTSGGVASYMKVYKEGSPVMLSPVSISSWSLTTVIRVTATSHGLSSTDQIYIDGVTDGDRLNGNFYGVTVINANTFDLKSATHGGSINPTGWGISPTGGTLRQVYKLATGIVGTALPDMQFAQKDDTLYVVHPDNDPIQIVRTSDTSWAKSTMSFSPGISAPSGFGVTITTGGSEDFRYVATSLSYPDFEESLPTSAVTKNNYAALSTSNPASVTWTMTSGADQYNIYRADNYTNRFGLVGVGYENPSSGGTGLFVDIGVAPDYSLTPPTDPGYFVGVNQVPGVISFFQQRLILAATNAESGKVWCSRTGFFKNFTIRYPIQDDDSIVFEIAGRQLQNVKHVVDIGRMVIFTTSGEWVMDGSGSDVLTPSTLSLKQQSYNGASDIPPLVITNSCLYVQARGSIVRDFGYDFNSDGYKGNDLTLFSSHLFDGYGLTRWTYQQTPHSNVWTVRDDGTLLCLTYIREQSMVAWSRHDMTNATVVDVAAIAENGEDYVYMLVQRSVDGLDRTYVERMASRQFTNVEDAKFLDSSVTYDGTNTGSTTMTLSGGSTWNYDETITLTASASYFASTDVGSEIHLKDSTGDIIRFSIDAYSSATVVTGKPHKTVPATLRSTAVTTWGKAVDTVAGLYHLEGLAVSVFADGYVVASPNNDSYDAVTVSGGYVTLDKCYQVIHVGRPYTCDVETLDIDVTQAQTLITDYKRSGEIHIMTEDTRGLWGGPKPPSDDSVDPLENLTEFKVRNSENYESPVALKTGIMNTLIQAHYNDNGRVFIRQVDPLPASILSIAPTGYYPIKR